MLKQHLYLKRYGKWKCRSGVNRGQLSPARHATQQRSRQQYCRISKAWRTGHITVHTENPKWWVLYVIQLVNRCFALSQSYFLIYVTLLWKCALNTCIMHVICFILTNFCSECEHAKCTLLSLCLLFAILFKIWQHFKVNICCLLRHLALRFFSLLINAVCPLRNIWTLDLSTDYPRFCRLFPVGCLTCSARFAQRRTFKLRWLFEFRSCFGQNHCF